MRWLWLPALAALAPTWFACNGSGALPDAVINKQADDPCDPGNGSQASGSAPPLDAGAIPLALPGGAGGIGFNDLRFSATLAQLLVPAAGTGDLDFVDPSTEKVVAVGGFTLSPTAGTSEVGVTSADEGNAIVYAVDVTSLTLTVVDGTTHAVVASTKLASAPGYVRYVAPTNEVWVTEPSEKRIEVFTLGDVETVTPTHAAFISVPGAESLEVDPTHELAFTNGPSSTYSITTDSARTVGAGWANGCSTAEGIAVDPSNGWVIVACQEGGAIVLAESNGAMKGKVATGAGVDRIAYDPVRLRLYVPATSKSALDVISIASGTGAPRFLGSVEAPPDAHCVVTPGGADLFLCSPTKGQLVLANDPF